MCAWWFHLGLFGFFFLPSFKNYKSIAQMSSALYRKEEPEKERITTFTLFHFENVWNSIVCSKFSWKIKSHGYGEMYDARCSLFRAIVIRWLWFDFSLSINFTHTDSVTMLCVRACVSLGQIDIGDIAYICTWPVDWFIFIFCRAHDNMPRAD